MSETTHRSTPAFATPAFTTSDSASLPLLPLLERCVLALRHYRKGLSLKGWDYPQGERALAAAEAALAANGIELPDAPPVKSVVPDMDAPTTDSQYRAAIVRFVAANDDVKAFLAAGYRMQSHEYDLLLVEQNRAVIDLRALIAGKGEASNV